MEQQISRGPWSRWQPPRPLDQWQEEHRQQADLCRALLPRWERRQQEVPHGYVPLTMHSLGLAA